MLAWQYKPQSEYLRLARIQELVVQINNGRTNIQEENKNVWRLKS
jgi:hypothetical protein